jgi:ArsR family transcriptional regulator
MEGICVPAHISIKAGCPMQTEAALFKVLSDPTRLRLAVLLANSGEICVCKLSAALGESQFKVSRHLAVMRFAGVVQARREGTWMHYSLSAPRNRLEQCVQACFRDCLGDHPVSHEDLRRLAAAELRGADGVSC